MDDRLKPPASEVSSKSRAISIGLALLGVSLSLIAGLFIAGLANTLQVLIIAAGITAFMIIFSRPDLGAAMLIGVLYTQAYIIVGERYGVTDVVYGLILLMTVCLGTRWILNTQEFPEGWMRPLLVVFFYCLVGLASVLYAIDALAARYVAVETFKSGAIALILTVVLRSERSFRLAIWTLLGVGIFLGSLSMVQFITGRYDYDFGGYAVAAVQNISGQTNDYRLGGPVGDPNYYAQMMLVLVPLALDRLWNEKRSVLRALAAWALGVCAFTVLLTYSRGGFLAMLAVVVIMLVIFHRGQLRYLVVVAIVSVVLVNFLPARFSERIGTLTELFPTSDASTPVTDYSLRGRTSEMIVALQMFADYPILGVGLGNYPVLYQQYAQRVGLEMRSEVRQAHSLYLEVAAETGIFGLFSFGLLLYTIFKAVWQTYQVLVKKGFIPLANMVAAYAFGFFGYLLAASFIHAAYPRNFWVLAGIALAIPSMARNEIDQAEIAQYKLKKPLAVLSSRKP